MKILTVSDKREEQFLRRRTQQFDFSAMGRKEVNDLVLRMKRVMRQASGIGLSANQIGLDSRVFVAEVPKSDGTHKFYAVFNPEMEKIGGEKATAEEGCLSVHNIYGRVPRATYLVIRGTDKQGKPLRIKASGLLARVFQHEIDHLDGKLFIDRAEELYHTPRADRLKEYEKKLKKNEQ